MTATQIVQLWGKVGSGGLFHPALYHMLDVGHVAEALLSPNASPRWRKTLARAFGVADLDQLGTSIPLLVAMHDIGKISAGFQAQRRAKQAERLIGAGFSFPALIEVEPPHHTAIGTMFAFDEWARAEQQILPEVLKRVVADASGGHHGVFPRPGMAGKVRRSYVGREPAEWRALRAGAYVLLRRSLCRGTNGAIWVEPEHRSAAAMALTGFTILCDWLGSDETYFKLHAPGDTESAIATYSELSHKRAYRAIEAKGWLDVRDVASYAGFTGLFPDDPPRPLQVAIDTLPPEAVGWPGLYVIEAPTGEGKTEAALALARRLAATGAGSDEIYVALPTTGTSNAMHRRVQAFVDRVVGTGLHVRLVHGQAHLNIDDQAIQPQSDIDLDTEGVDNASAAQDWFAPRKRALLAAFGTGTVDQLELGALNAPHYMLRLVGLAGKVVIVDEVHAYDTYMSTVLEQVLRWLAVLGSSVVLLSATLPVKRREDLAKAFAEAVMPAGSTDPLVSVPGARKPRSLPSRRTRETIRTPQTISGGDVTEGNAQYPLISAYTAGAVHQSAPRAFQPERRIQLQWLPALAPEQEARELLEMVRDGGVVCQICNTVAGAQRLFRAVDTLAAGESIETGVECHLLHARLPLEERLEREGHLAERFGRNDSQRPARAVVVGTQVLEQSLDLDFDALISDLAPLDLLLQRVGRLHRHDTHLKRGRHRTPTFGIRLDRSDDEAPRFGSSADVYSPFILWKSFVILEQLMPNGRGELVLPRDYRPLVEQTYDDRVLAGRRWEARMIQARKKHIDEQHRQVDGATLRLAPTPRALQTPSEVAGAQQVFDEDASSEHWIRARTRWGDEGVTVTPLHVVDGRVCLFPDGREPLPLADKSANRSWQLQLLRRSLPVSSPPPLVMALRPGGKRPGGGTESTVRRWFSDRALLRTVAPILLVNGSTLLGDVRLTLDRQLGLIIEREAAP